MKYYASCSVCAHKLMKGENGTQADIRCPRCKTLIHIGITENTVAIHLIDEQVDNTRYEQRPK